MKRKVRLLSAILVMALGFTGCGEEKGEVPPSEPMEVRLGQAEVTATNGKATVDVSIDGFDGISYLQVETPARTEKYEKVLLAESYQYEYAVQADDPEDFTLTFKAVDANGTASEAAETRVHKGEPVSLSGPLTFDNLRCVSRVTGKEENGVGLLPAVDYVVNNRTDELYNVGGTDLGIVWEIEPGSYGLFFGDTYGSDFRPNQAAPGPNGGSWRSNVLLYSHDTDLSDGLTIDGAAMSDDGRQAREICYGGKDTSGNGDYTSIPTAAIHADGADYVHYMNIRNWTGWVTNFSSLYKSTDQGKTWTRCEDMQIASRSNFGQVGYAKHDGYVYMVGTVTGRANKPHLARFLETDIENPKRYEYWNGGGWVRGKESAAVVLFDDIAGELSVAYHPLFNKWIILYFNDPRYEISMRTADYITGPWSEPSTVASGWQYAQLYGSFIHPLSLEGDVLYFIMSMWCPYNTYLMSVDLAQD